MSGFTIVAIMVLVMLSSVAVLLLAADESELTASTTSQESVEENEVKADPGTAHVTEEPVSPADERSNEVVQTPI